MHFIETVLSNSLNNSENMDKAERVERSSVLIRCVLAPMISLFMVREGQS